MDRIIASHKQAFYSHQSISLPCLKNKTKKPNRIPCIANGDGMHNPYVVIFYLQARGMMIHHILCKLITLAHGQN